jgi:membrane-associated phospholipid phosphatase
VNKASFNIVDRLTLAYNAIILAIILLFHSRIHQWPLQTLPNLFMIAGVLVAVLVIGNRAALPARLARYLYPMFFFMLMYEQTGKINHILFPGFLDSCFRQVEGQIFGMQPAVVFAQRFPQRWLAEYMHCAYFSYYLLFMALGVFLYLRRSRAAFFDYMLSLCGTAYFCFLIYVFLPVRGAVTYELGDAPGNGPFTSVMGVIYRYFEVEGAAFPSSHVAVAAVVLYYTIRYARPATWIVGPLVISLMAATVYCRYHYTIDVLAGLATAALLIPLWRAVNPELRQ